MKFEAVRFEFITQKDENYMKNDTSAIAWKLVWSTKFLNKTKTKQKIITFSYN